MPSRRTAPNISPRRTALRSKGLVDEAGQALIELLAIIVIFCFVGLAVFETGILYHNMNVISNGLKQATWAASYGAQNDKINLIMQTAETDVLLGAFIMHTADSFVVEVWEPALDTGVIETAVDPISLFEPVYFTGHQQVSGIARRAAYLARSEGMNIRLGITYTCAYTVPLYGSMPIFSAKIPLSVSEPIHCRNDEDRDGMVDLYEDEIFKGFLGWATHVPISHMDRNGMSDTPYVNTADIDGDGRPDKDEDTAVLYGTGSVATRATYSNWIYDWDNDGREDRFEKPASSLTDTQNRICHPITGGPWTRVVLF